MTEVGSDRNTFAARHAAMCASVTHRGNPEDAGQREDPENPNDVMAMPVILHIPKADPPDRSSLLEAAARACVELCLDERVGPGGEWHAAYMAWIGVRIRKIARRARGGQWVAAQQVPGVVRDCGGQARAIVPGRIGDVDRRISRLQIGGTDLPDDEPGPADPAFPILWVDDSLEMTTGKTAAQVGHASMVLAAGMSTAQAQRWSQSGYACSVRHADETKWAAAHELLSVGRAVAVRDAGFTEVTPGSTTIIAVFADERAQSTLLRSTT